MKVDGIRVKQRRQSGLAPMAGLGLMLTLPIAGCDFFISGSGSPDTDKLGATGPVTSLDDETKKTVEQEFVYNPIGKRDPFQSFIPKGGEGGIVGDGPPPTGTQKYELDQYRLVGIIWGVERPRALMQDPEEVGHVAEIGTYVGRNWGKITMITSGEVVVTEEYQTIDGELVVNNISMRLPGTDDPGGSR
jgi:type IV pilus assembly protein PilP